MKTILTAIMLVAFSFSGNAQHPFVVSYKKARLLFNTNFRPLESLTNEYDAYNEFVEDEYFDVNNIEEVENVNDFEKLHLSAPISAIPKSSSGIYSYETKKAIKEMISIAEDDPHSEVTLLNAEIEEIAQEADQISAQSKGAKEKYNGLYEIDKSEAEELKSDVKKLQSNMEYLAKNIQSQEKSVQWAQNTYNTCVQNGLDCTLSYNNLNSYKITLQTMYTNYNKIIAEEQDKRNWYNNNVDEFKKANELYSKKLNQIIEVNNQKIEKNNLRITELYNKKYQAYFNYYQSKKAEYIRKRKEEYANAINKMKEFGGGSGDLEKIEKIKNYAATLFETLDIQKYTPMVQWLQELEEIGKAHPVSRLGHAIATVGELKQILDDFVTAYDTQAPPFLLMQNYVLTKDDATNKLLKSDRDYLIKKFKSGNDNIVDIYENIYRQSKIEILGWGNIHFILWFEHLPNLSYLSLDSDVFYDFPNFKNLNVSTLKIKAGNAAILEGMSKMPKLKKVIITPNDEVKKKDIKALCESIGIASDNCVIMK